MTAQAVKPMACEFYKSTEHKTYECHMLFEGIKDVNAVGGWASNRVPARQGTPWVGPS